MKTEEADGEANILFTEPFVTLSDCMIHLGYNELRFLVDRITDHISSNYHLKSMSHRLF